MPRTLGSRLTARQQQVLDAINRYHDAHGMAPTVRELCDLLHIRSTSTIQRHIEALRRKGALVDSGPGMPRALVATAQPVARPPLHDRAAVLRFCRDAIDAFRAYRRQGSDVLAAERLAMEQMERVITGAGPVPAPREEALT